MSDYTDHMIRGLDDEAIDNMVSESDDCFCGECLCCVAKDEKERRKNAKISKKVKRNKGRLHKKKR